MGARPHGCPLKGNMTYDAKAAEWQVTAARAEERASALDAEVERLREWLFSLVNEVNECLGMSIETFGGAIVPNCPECDNETFGPQNGPHEENCPFVLALNDFNDAATPTPGVSDEQR